MSASRALFFTGLIPSSRSISLLVSGSRMLALSGCMALTLAACGGGGGGGAGFGNGGGLGTNITVPSGGSGSGGSSGSGGTAPTTPVYSLGNGSGSGFKDGLIDTNKTTLDSGDTATLRVNVVDQANNPPAVDLAVTFASTCTSSGLASFGTVTQVTRGLFSVDYTNRGCDRPEDTIVATLTTNGDQATTKIKMVGPDVLSVSFVSATPTQLALAGIGGNESSELIFKVVGPQGVPVIGKTVDFSLNTQVGGASVLAGRGSAVTDQSGQVRTIINSGTIAGPVNVKAVERSTGRQGISSDIVISTGVADFNFFSLSVDNFNPSKAWEVDNTKVNFTIIASDIFGNNPTDGTRVSFVSPEMGNIQNSCSLSNGTCSVEWRSSGTRPKDGRVSILAYTSGAEHFVDNNGNSVYDSTDGAINDIGEPYADENDSQSYNLGEFFFDTNKNGVRDNGNSKWDGPCLVKVDVRAVCTGEATVAIYRGATIVLARTSPDNSGNYYRIKTLGTFPAPTTAPTAAITLVQGTSVTYTGLVLKDSNTDADGAGGNPLPRGTTITFSIQNGGASIVGNTSYTVPDALTPEQAAVMGITIGAAVVDVGGTLPKNVVLNMKVAFPDGTLKETNWPMNITF